MCTKERLKSIDYKSIALPAELQGLDLICRINSLFNQVIQSLKDLSPARSCRCSQRSVPQCSLIVTDLSVSYRHEDPTSHGILNMCFHPLKLIKIMEWKNENNKIYTC